APGPHMCESRIPEGGEITCQFGRSAAPCNGVGGRNCRRRKTIETRHPPSEPRCESPLAHFEHGDIRLRNAKTNCRLDLSQPLARPCCPQIRGTHRTWLWLLLHHDHPPSRARIRAADAPRALTGAPAGDQYRRHTTLSTNTER